MLPSLSPHFKKQLSNILNDNEPVKWPDTFVNKSSRHQYKPHNELEGKWVYDDEPRFILIKGGEGSGKSVALSIKTLHKLRRGMSGVLVSPNLPHFKRSLFPEFLRWLPEDVVIEEHRKIFHPSWSPWTSFDIVVHNEIGGYSTLTCVGADNPVMLEGPNLNFAALDEIRGMPNDEIIKVLTGRIRIPGPNGEPPQLYAASTPKMHWMFDYFGPLLSDDEPDIYRDFKLQSYVVTLKTEDNVKAGNIDAEYVQGRGASLTETEKLARLAGEWVDENADTRFLESITLWDSLYNKNLPPVSLRTSNSNNYSDNLVVALDAGVSHDKFGLVAVSRDPTNRSKFAVRTVRIWHPPVGGKIDFLGSPEKPGPELFLRKLCQDYRVIVACYDNYQMHDMATRLTQDGVVWMKDFSQGELRAVADQNLYDKIMTGQIAHDNNPDLRRHINNADAAIRDDRKRRLVKRANNMNIDLAVCLSMAIYECGKLNI